MKYNRFLYKTNNVFLHSELIEYLLELVLLNITYYIYISDDK